MHRAGTVWSRKRWKWNGLTEEGCHGDRYIVCSYSELGVPGEAGTHLVRSIHLELLLTSGEIANTDNNGPYPLGLLGI